MEPKEREQLQAADEYFDDGIKVLSMVQWKRKFYGMKENALRLAEEKHAYKKKWKTQKKRADELADLLQEAIDCINNGAVKIMTLDQLSKWEGCRAIIEIGQDLIDNHKGGE